MYNSNNSIGPVAVALGEEAHPRGPRPGGPPNDNIYYYYYYNYYYYIIAILLLL